MLHFFNILYHTRWIWMLCCLSLGLFSPAHANSTHLKQLLQHPSLSAPHTGAQVIALKTGDTIFSHNANTLLMPASNLKIVTSAAALSLLKPEFHFKTALYTDGYQRGNNLKGNLYLKGFGDPVLDDEHLYQLMHELRYLGIQTIEGNLIVDDSYFDSERMGRGWKNTYGAAAYSARISALSLNLNTVEVRIRPNQTGQQASVTLKPENSFFQIVNKTYTSGSSTRLNIARQLVNGHNQIIVSGNVSARGRTEIETINLDNPTLYVGNVALTQLQKEGIVLKGKLQGGVTPSSAQLLGQTLSPPLREIIADLNKKSINLIAENILKFMGANFEGAPGSALKGAKVIQERFLSARVGLPAQNGIILADGSGLSPLNRITPDALARVLQYMYEEYDVGVDFVSSLAISGVDGTLNKRMNTPELKRRIRAKTGFINGVSGLSGFVYTKQKDVVVFSFLMNHFRNYQSATAIQDQLCAQLANL